MKDWGVFPFGRPNTVRPARMVRNADVVVVGVYPSAWHVAWRAPPHLVKPGASGGVAALAVDVEPTVFWDGNADDYGERLARWKAEVGFVDGKHGAISAKPPKTNGSSGDKVVRHYLTPLGLGAERTTFTDVYPVFLIKSASGSRREQGDAIRAEYDSIAPAMGLPTCTLPARIARAKLPALAAAEFADRLLADLDASRGPLVITLGEEVWATFMAIERLQARPPCTRFDELYGDTYGQTGKVNVAGRELTWLPLVHPGLLKGSPSPDAALDFGGGRTPAGWATLHARWASLGARP